MWEAEHVVDEQLARRLIREHCPGVAADTVELVAAGWDYTVHRVDDEWAFRFPRREIVLEPMQTELRVLPRLAPQVPFAVPAPMHRGEGRWPFYGSRWIPGHEATEAPAGIAPQLGGALRALHDAHVDGLAFDVQKRADMEFRVPRAREELAAIGRDAPEELFAAALDLPPPTRTVVCHGDLHFRQVLVDGERLRGIVDWVDVCVSDPGIDLIVAFMLFDEAERELFFDAYGGVGEHSLIRARVLTLFLGAVLTQYGRANANAPVERAALASLDRAVSGF